MIPAIKAIQNAGPHTRIFVLISLLSVYVYGLLSLADVFMSAYIHGYQTQVSLEIDVILFFVCTYLFATLGYRYGWQPAYPYYFFALAIYFPLVLFSSLLRVHLDLNPMVEAYYINEFCTSVNAELPCGEALAYMVYSMTIRSLPAIATVPLLYIVLARTLVFSLNIKTDERIQS